MKVPKGQKVPEETPRDVQTRLGAAIKAQRQRLGVTQEELAWRADMHRTYLADIERGSRNVTLRSMANLARALQVTVGELLGKYDGALVGPPIMGEILLVEDDPVQARAALRVFKQAHFSNPVKWVRNARTALEYLFCEGRFARRHPVLPQLVLLDLDLPDQPGLETLRAIKRQARTRGVPVIVIAASCADRRVKEAIRRGAANCLTKPVEFSSFSEVTPKLNLHWALVASRNSPSSKTSSK